MANSTTKEVAIYRCTNTGDTEANLPNGESLGMDYGMRDTSDVAVMIFNWIIPDRQTDVPNPQARALSKPDTGISNITLYVGIKFNEDASENDYIGTLARWGIDQKTVRGVFSNGRFGVRNDKKVWMNFQPTDTAGWKIVENNTDDLLQFGNLCDVLITLQFAGNTKELIDQIVANGG